MKQVIFKDIENNVIHGGILLDSGDIICGCCGGLLEADEENETWELIDTYDDWIDLDETICGDELETSHATVAPQIYITKVENTIQ